VHTSVDDLTELYSKTDHFQIFPNKLTGKIMEQVAHNPLVDTKEFKFSFKKDKLGNKRSAVELKLPVPSYEGIQQILQAGGKGLELLQDVIYDTIRGAAAGYVADDLNISQETFPIDKVTWEAIANAPKSERKSIPDELWAAFAEDYTQVMPAATGKSADAVANAVAVYLKKFSVAKTNKPVLQKLKEQLGIYMETSPRAEEFADILELLINKADAYLKADDVEMILSNL
jgi:hypothetical protein